MWEEDVDEIKATWTRLTEDHQAIADLIDPYLEGESEDEEEKKE